MRKSWFCTRRLCRHWFGDCKPQVGTCSCTDRGLSAGEGPPPAPHPGLGWAGRTPILLRCKDAHAYNAKHRGAPYSGVGGGRLRRPAAWEGGSPPPQGLWATWVNPGRRKCPETENCLCKKPAPSHRRGRGTLRHEGSRLHCCAPTCPPPTHTHPCNQLSVLWESRVQA